MREAADLDRLAAGIERLELQNSTLATEMRAVVRQASTRAFTFTTASPSDMGNLFRPVPLHCRPALELPDLAHLPPAGTLTPFEWAGRGGERAERTASVLLLPLLRDWVTTDMEPAITNAFVDVQPTATRSAMRIHAEGMGTFSGMTDMVILNNGLIAGEVSAPLVNCVVSVDWKHPTRFGITNKFGAALQAVAFSRVQGTDSTSPPVFFTDLSTGFRCWQLVEGRMGIYHDAAGSSLLSLEAGVALIRHFLRAQAAAGFVRSSQAAAAATHVAAGASNTAAATGARAAAPGPGSTVSGGALAAASGAHRFAMPPVKQAHSLVPDSTPDSVLLEVTSREEEAALFQSITHSLAVQWSSMGGICMEDFYG